MVFTDTHCHIHEASYADQEAVYSRALETGVRRMICVGTDEMTSVEAVEFARTHDSVWASVGLHPHDSVHDQEAITALEKLVVADKATQQPLIVAIGECGLDYFYNHSPRAKQIEMLHAQLSLARTYALPVIFHVREAFDDFWPIYDQYQLRGVVHSFTDSQLNLESALERGLYIGVNGISTFTKIQSQIDMYTSIPMQNLLLETDSPYLTPHPKRGNVNEPAFVTHVAQHIANLQSINLKELSRVTEQNATNLFFK